MSTDLEAGALGLCIVGPGGIAQEHARALNALGRCANVFVVGADAAEADAFAATWGFSKSGGALDEALGDPAVDVVLIASPNHLHVEQAASALRAGKHAVVEVPLALAAADARELMALAHRSGRRLFVCSTWRSYPGVRRLRSLLCGEAVPSQLLGISATPRRDNQHWKGGTRSWIDNIVWHHGWHLLDAAHWASGQPEIVDVHAVAGAPSPRFGMTMDIAVTMQSATRTLYSLTLSYNSKEDFGEIWAATSDEYYVLRETELQTHAGRLVEPGRPWSDLRAQDGAILEALRTGEACDYDADSFAQTVSLLGTIAEQSGAR